MAICPYCGKSIGLVRASDRGMLGASSWGRSTLFESTAATPWLEAGDDLPAKTNFTEWERREPVRAATFESDVRVPFMTALFSGVFGGLAFVMPCILWEWPWWIPATVACVLPIGVWVWTVADGRAILRRVEKIVNHDIDGDGAIGPQAVQHEYIFNERQADGSGSWSIVLGLPDIGPEKLATFAKAILGGASTGTSAWVGTGGIFSRAQYDTLRDVLVSKGLARWVSTRSKAAGWALTKKGADLFAAWAGGDNST